MDADSVLAILLPFEILCLSCLSPPSSPLSLGGRRLFLHLTSSDSTFAEGHQYCFKEDNLLQREGWKYNPTVDSFQTPTRSVLISSQVCKDSSAVVHPCISQPMPPFTSGLPEWGSGRLVKEHPPQLGPESNQFPVGGCSDADGGEGRNVSTRQPHHRGEGKNF